MWYPSGTGDGGLVSAVLSPSGVSLCAATSAPDVVLSGEGWRSNEPGEFGEVVAGLELRLTEGFLVAPLWLSDWPSLGRADPFSCTWTGVMKTVA